MARRKKSSPTDPIDLKFVLLQLTGSNAQLLRDFINMTITNTPDFLKHDGVNQGYLLELEIPFSKDSLDLIPVTTCVGQLEMKLEVGDEGCVCFSDRAQFSRRQFANIARIYTDSEIVVSAVEAHQGQMSNTAIKTWLREHMKTQKWLAAVLEVDYPTVHRWLNESYAMPMFLRKNLALILAHELQKEQLKDEDFTI